jgi:hypothetical protein
MRNAIVFAGFLLLILGVFLARDRVRVAFQIGAVLYAVSLVVRFFIFGLGDPDNLLDLLTIFAVFFVIWLVARTIVEAIIRHRARTRPPPG